MRTALFISCCLTLILFTGSAFGAQDTMPPSSWKQTGPQAHIERGLDLMVQGNIDAAFKTLFGKSHTKETLDKLKFELYSLTKKNGKPFAYEKLIEQKAGSSVIRYRYILLFQKQPTMFDFYYYKSKNGWLLKNISFTKDVKKIFVR